MGSGRPNGTPQNLIPFNKMDKDKAREIHAKGGKASGESKRARKSLKEELILLLSQGDTQKQLSISLLAKAFNGDVRAFEVIRDTIGEKPVEKQEIKQVDTNWFIDG